MCHAYAVEKNHPQVVVLFPRPHSNCSRINNFFTDLGWLSIQNKKTIVKRVYYGIDLVKGVMFLKADFEFRISNFEF